MDLTLLRYFYTIAQEGSFLAAAQKLNYAQSNLSTRIRQLEHSLGTDLFIRSRNGVSLTEKGQILYEYAGKILSLSEEAESRLRENTYVSGELVISSMESAAVTFLPGLLSDFHETCPEVSIRVRTGTSDAGVRAVEKGESDLAFVVGKNEGEGLESIPLKKEKLILAASTETDQTPSFHELLARPLLVFPYGCAYRRVLERMLTDENIAPVNTLEFTSLGAILASASAGLGICLFPEQAFDSFVTEKTLKLYEVPEQYRTVTIYMLYRKSSAHNQTLIRFLERAQLSQADGRKA